MYKSITQLVNKRFVFVLLLVFLANFAAICSREPNTPADRGVFYSNDFGETYEQKNRISDEENLDRVDVLNITIDDFNSKVMYLSTVGSGIYKSTNSGDTWQKTSQESGTVYNVAVNPKNNRVLYATVFDTDNFGKILRSGDAGKTWREIYRETDIDSKVYDVAIDHFNTEIVYASNEQGAILKSEDAGENWVVKKWIDDGRAIFLKMSPFDSREMFVVSPDFGMYKSFDAAETWSKVEFSAEDFPGATETYDMQFDPIDANVIYTTSKYGMLKSSDKGLNWEPIDLLRRAGDNSVIRFVIEPQDPQTMYLALDQSMYKTIDGGKTWSVREKVTSSTIFTLTIHPEEPGNIYAGVWYRGEQQ